MLDGLKLNLTTIPSDTSLILERLSGSKLGFTEFPGFDYLIFGNAGLNPLDNPMLGVDPSNTDSQFATYLLQGGWAKDPLFGGNGPETLNSLEPGRLYATLIPKIGTIFNLGFADKMTGGLHLPENEKIYLDDQAIVLGRGVVNSNDLINVDQTNIPEPATWILLLSGLMGLIRFRNRMGQVYKAL